MSYGMHIKKGIAAGGFGLQMPDGTIVPFVTEEGIMPITNNVARVILEDDDGDGGVFAWENPIDADLIIKRVMIHITEESDNASTIDVGTAADATTSSDNLLDGLDTGAAEGIFDNIDDQGTNGESVQVLEEGEFITATQASGDVSDLEGVAYIEFVVID